MASIASPRPMPASGASTPTASSRRTSLDTNRTASPARGGTLSTPTSTTGTGGGRRNRTALRDYYNLKPPPHSSASGTSPARASSIAEETSSTGSVPDDDNESLPGIGGVPITELDAPGFDPSAYVSRTLETQGLSGVLRAAGSLVNEIRELDGERKALVYDNYSKLIAATDTIRGMRANITNSTSVLASHGPQVSPANLAGLSSSAASSLATASGLEAEKPVTEELKRLVELVATIAQELAGTAAEKKEEVRDGVEEDKRQQEREKKERARQTVRWVVESPARFRLYVTKGEVDKARQEWRDVGRLLDKWEGTEGVVEVRKGCLEVLKGADGGGESEDESSEEEGEENDDDGATKPVTGKTASSNGDD